jgi:hypothetical protein
MSAGLARRREVPQVGRFTYVPVAEPDDERALRARPLHSSSGQTIVGVARPMMSTTGGAPVTQCLVPQLDIVRGEVAHRVGSDILHVRSLACKAFDDFCSATAALHTWPRPMK